MKAVTMANDLELAADALPDPTRPDAGLVLISEWHTQSREEQKRVMSGVMDAWENTRLPAAYLSRYCLEGSDGRTILNYAQWTNSDAHRAFAANPQNQQTLGNAIQSLFTAGPPGRYTLHRSIALREATVGYFTTASYDTEDPATARELADELVARSTAAAPSELIAEHFHISEDGQRLYVLSAHEAEPAEITARFRPFRGLARRWPVAT
ncbi:hypothetical protein [Streptomyces sp. NPDC088801]|uniref:hypothetical protein n=1 Tax=Streptomyces sp. NPDC088801 TaxID=3365903 RepID=UPI0037F16F8E